MIQKSIYVVIIACAFAISSGCSINHHIANDYSKYLANNQDRSKLPSTKLEASYSMTPNTENHRYEFRSAMVGYANLWIIEFGKILDETLKSKDVQNAFRKLQKQAGNKNDNGKLIVFDLVEYAYYEFGAHVVLKISLFTNGNEIFEKVYKADGKTQGGKMFLTGAFGMKNAIQQSTKLSIDEILKSFLIDTNSIYGKLEP